VATKETTTTRRIPEEVKSALLLDYGETPLISWGCLLSFEPKNLRSRQRLLELALTPLTYGMSMASPDAWSGHVVLTNRRLIFVENSLVPGRCIQGYALPLEFIEDVSANEELAVNAPRYGWKLFFRKVQIEGIAENPSMPADILIVAEALREAINSRESDLEKRRRARALRIQAFNETRRKH